MSAWPCVALLQGHTYNIIGIAITPDGNTVVSGGYDGLIRIWDFESGTLLRALSVLEVRMAAKEGMHGGSGGSPLASPIYSHALRAMPGFPL